MAIVFSPKKAYKVPMSYHIQEAYKSQLGNSRKVIANNKIYLRILKNRSSNQNIYPFEVVTATAGDDSKKGKAIQEPNSFDRGIALKAAAEVVRDKFSIEPILQTDWQGRSYISIGFCTEEGAKELIEDFFKAFMKVSSDVQGLTTNSEEDDLTSIYNNLCVTEGEDVYLSDGLWLTESGNLIEK